MGDSEAHKAGEQPAEFAGRELLRGDSPRAILAKITQGDPLELRARCAERQADLAYLISLDRLFAKALALTARAASNYRGEPPLASWLRAQVELALEHALVEDRNGETADEHFEFASREWRVEPALAREACIVFNGLPISVRAAYWAIVMQGKTIYRYVAEGHGPPELVRKRVQRAITALGTLADPGGIDGPSRGQHGR